MDWLQANLGTVLVGTVLFALVLFVIIRMIRAKKRGESSCSCGCSSCPSASFCHSKQKKADEEKNGRKAK